MPYTPPPDIEVKCWFCGEMTLLDEMHEACRRRRDYWHDWFNKRMVIYTQIRRQQDPQWGRRNLVKVKATAKVDDSKVEVIRKKPKPEAKDK